MRRSRVMIWGFITLAICLYSLPWVINPGASLMLNAYDLAEWSSLHPAVRFASPPLLVTFALRSPLLWISILIAFAPQTSRWLRFLALLAVTAVLLPPPEFFSSSLDDPNYRQMLLLSGAALIAGIVGITYRGQRWRTVAQLLAIGGIIIASLIGLVAAVALMREFILPAQIGPGGTGLILLSIMYGAGLIIKRGNLREVTS